MSSGISRMKWRGKLSLEGLSLARHEILPCVCKTAAHTKLLAMGPGIKEDK